jgi:hypothetical protein
MMQFSQLTETQRAQLEQFVDQLHRPAVLSAWKLMNQFKILLAQALASPSGATSTAASPAADSIWGLIASLDVTEVVPLINSGLAGAQPLQAQVLLWNLADFASTLDTHYTDAALQNYALTVGAVNIGG